MAPFSVLVAMTANGGVLACDHAVPHDLPDANVLHLPGWLAAAEADQLLYSLQAEVPWETHRIRMFGNWADSPRLSCWIGDPQARYRYSGAEFAPRPGHRCCRPCAGAWKPKATAASTACC